jgi:hypothetical protein
VSLIGAALLLASRDGVSFSLRGVRAAQVVDTGEG